MIFQNPLCYLTRFLLSSLGKTVGNQLSSELKNVEKKVLENKMCVEKQMDEIKVNRGRYNIDAP